MRKNYKIINLGVCIGAYKNMIQNELKRKYPRKTKIKEFLQKIEEYNSDIIDIAYNKKK